MAAGWGACGIDVKVSFMVVLLMQYVQHVMSCLLLHVLQSLKSFVVCA